MAKRKRRRKARTRLWRLVRLPFIVGAVCGGILVGGVFWLSNRPVAPGRPALDPLRARPQDYAWTQQPEPAFPIPPYARFLAGASIVLDPGHVGQRDPGGTWKRGPTGLREAEVNLRAHFLREFLTAAGAKVVLTRETDENLDLPDKEDLRQRAEVANQIRADLLLSIHHNANDKPEPNYTSVFYHGTPDDSPASIAAGRFLVAGLNDALRLTSHLECALLSDHAVYEKNGFGLLRQAEVPAVLSEASFHSNPAEEARLRDPVYNRREAYGLFLGLARWAQAGLPRVALVQASNGTARRGGEVVIGLDDGLSGRGGWGAEQSKILAESLTVKLDSESARYKFDAGKRQVHVTLPSNVRGTRCVLYVDFENIFGQHVLHPNMTVELGGH